MQECYKAGIEEQSKAGQSSDGQGAQSLCQGHQTGRETQ